MHTYTIAVFYLLLSVQLCFGQTGKVEASTDSKDWTLGPFKKQDAYNPCLTALATTTFNCPVRKQTVKWEEKDVFNPAAVVKDGKVYLLYRAEDKVGKFAGTSRIGLAISSDGVTFTRQPKPVLYPDNDFMKPYEWEGGCEDPRIVEDEKGTYYMTYTTYDGKTARLCVATSTNLINWKKQGLAFGKAAGKYKDLWSKSGAIVSRREGSRIVATKVNGKYWMYWGDTNMFIATSDDLINWKPVEQSNGQLAYILAPRPGKFDSDLVEPGPPALITDKGILVLYNSRNKETKGDPKLPAGTYAAGQALLDPKNPAKLLARTDNYFMRPEKEYEITGQVGNVCFVEGMVYYKDKWFLYYGTADSKIAVAMYQPKKDL